MEREKRTVDQIVANINGAAEASSVAVSAELRDSIEVTRDAKGAYKFVVKLYFDGHSEAPPVDAAASIYDNLLQRFEA